MEDLKRRLYYKKRGIVDILNGKGEYLLKERNKIFYVYNQRKEEIELIRINSKDLLDLNWVKFDGYRKDKIWLLSFCLKENELSSSMGDLIVKLLNELDKRNIHWRISKPLPPCIFNKGVAIIKKSHIPQNCKSCLELLVVNRCGNDNLFCDIKSNNFIFYRSGRSQLAELFADDRGVAKIKKCGECNIKNDCSFWIWKYGCYFSKPMSIPSFNSRIVRGWKDSFFQDSLIRWWFLQYKWEMCGDIPIWQRFLKDRFQNDWIIDAGGGHGRNAFGLYRISKKLVLVDIGRSFFKYTKQRQGQTGVYFPFINADISKLHFKDESAGLVYSGGVLHSMPESEKERHLKECCRVLRNGGLVIGFVISDWEIGVPPDIWPVTYKKDIESLFSRSGFASVKIVSKVRINGEPQQYWLFLALKAKNKVVESKMKSCSLGILDGGYSIQPGAWTVALRYRKNILALYDFEKERYYMPRVLTSHLWELFKQGKKKEVSQYIYS